MDLELRNGAAGELVGHEICDDGVALRDGVAIDGEEILLGVGDIDEAGEDIDVGCAVACDHGAEFVVELVWVNVIGP